MKRITIGTAYKLNGANQYGFTRDGKKIIIETNEVVIKVRDNILDRLKYRNMFRIFGTFTELDIDQSIIDRYFTEHSLFGIGERL